MLTLVDLDTNEAIATLADNELTDVQAWRMQYIVADEGMRLIYTSGA